MESSSAPYGIFTNVRSFVERSFANRFWDWQAATLTIILVQISSGRLVITDWAPSLLIVQKISLYAVLIGLILGYSSFRRRNVFWAALEYGLLLIPMQLLKTVEKTDYLYNDLKFLMLRLWDAFNLFLQKQPVYDTLFFATLSAFGFWLVGCYAGYRLMRHRDFLDVVLPPGLIMLIIQLYDGWNPLRIWGLAVFVFTALILLGRLLYLENKNEWKRKRIFIGSDSEWELMRSVLVSAGIVVFIAWALPGALSSVKPAADAWRKFTRPITERLSDAVSALDSPYGSATSGDFYGKDLKLSNSAPISDTPVLYVKVEGDPVELPRYYWRGRTYDQYINGQWTNTGIIRQNFNPDQDEIKIEDTASRVDMQFTFTINFPKQELLYAPAEAIWVSRNSRLVAAPTAGEEREITAWLADPGLLAGNRYEVHARIANPTIDDLLAAGTEYPDWVKQRYLQVPQETQLALKDLTTRITQPYNTPYEKAQAITSYLRFNIKYQTNISDAPPNRKDPLLWVLFEYKKGFCMYYASAEVLMLRTIGIPARMAVGFAEGEYDEEVGRYVVARLNAHAWPEVYFPGIGWVEFEPTANQDPLNRPQARKETSNNSTGTNPPGNPLANIDGGSQDPAGGRDPTLLEDVNLPPSQTANPWARLLLLITGTAGLLGVGIFLARRYSIANRLPKYLTDRYTRNNNTPPRWLGNWTRWAMLSDVEKPFHAINLSLYWLGDPQAMFVPSSQRATTLIQHLPEAEKEITALLQEYQTALYTQYNGDPARARRAAYRILIKTWKRLITKSHKRRYNQLQ